MKPEMQKALLATAGRYIRKLFGEIEPRIKAIEERQAEIPALVQRAVDALPRPQDGRSVTLADVEPLLRSMVDALPPPQDGKSVTVDEVVEAIMPRLEDRIEASIAKAALDFERRAQGVLERAIAAIPKPKDGRDGLDLRHFKAEQVDERTVTLTLSDGERTEHVHLTFPVVIDRGVFSETGKPDGGLYEKGDGVTFGGSFWIAQIDDPQGVPGMSKDWRLAVKKGRDGKSVAKLPGREGPTTVRLPGAKPPADDAGSGSDGEGTSA